MHAPPPVGSVIPPSTDEIIAAQLAALEKSRKEMEKSDLFRKKSSESSSVTGASLSERDSWGPLTPARPPYSAYRASPKSSAKVRPRGFASPDKTPTPSLSRLGIGGKPMAAPDSMAASSATRLIINPSPKPKLKLSLQPDKSSPSPLVMTNGSSPAQGLGQTPKPVSTPATPAGVSTPGSSNMPNGRVNNGYDYYQQVVGSPSDEAAGTPKRVNVAPRLTKAGYTCTPPIDVLSTMSAEDLAAVPNFAVERPGVGKIEWEGAVDIRGIDLDSVVVIEAKSASVYTKEEEENRKPAVGTKLNRSAIITLEGVYAPEATQDSQEKFSKKVERQTKKMGSQLIYYDARTGVWKLRVQHFSRYALDDDDDSSSEQEEQRVHFEAGEREGRSRAVEGRIQRQATPYKPPRVLKSAAVVVEVEEEDEEIGQNDVDMALESKADEAFEVLQTKMKEQMQKSKKRNEETAEFAMEGGLSRTSSPPTRYVPTMDDLDSASSMGGICSDIAKKAGVQKSSIDFGQRMGRSFRVGWAPDGSFLCRAKDGRLERRRPKFVDGKPSSGDNILLLKQHQQNAEELQGKGSCPHFSLPLGDGLDKALNSYVDHASTEPSVAKESFALLKCLTKGGDGTYGDFLAVPSTTGRDDEEARRLYAIQQWLVDACAVEVTKEIMTATGNSEKNSALLAAISGGDVGKACSLAESLGFHQLAAMVAAGPEGRVDILNAAMAWTDTGAASRMPDDLIRSYFVLGGDLKMEEDIFKRGYSTFDWRRRFAMTMTYGAKTPNFNLSDIVTEYENKVTRGFAPYPQPRYLRGEIAERTQCVSYRLLRLGSQELDMTLREIIDPTGHTVSVNDFSLAFHLAAAISAMANSEPLSEVEEATLIDGYASQLAAEGYWEWAVYVLLCQFSPGSASVSTWKQKQAKMVVLRNFSSSAADRRMSLESVGVPSKWFEEALALRCGTIGDSFGYLSHMVNVNPDEACASLEYTVVPNMFFMNKADLASARHLLDAFSVDSSSLAGAVFDFFQIHEDIARLEHAAQPEIDVAVPTLLERCEQVEHTLASYRSGEAKLQGPTLRIIPEKKTVPMACFLAEGLSQISLFKLQLRALQSQMSISSTATQILNLAQPNEMIDSGISARENILRWLM